MKMRETKTAQHTQGGGRVTWLFSAIGLVVKSLDTDPVTSAMPTSGNLLRFQLWNESCFFVSRDDTITSLGSSADVNKSLGVATSYILPWVVRWPMVLPRGVITFLWWWFLVFTIVFRNILLCLFFLPPKTCSRLKCNPCHNVKREIQIVNWAWI